VLTFYFELEVKSHGGVISFKSSYIHFRQHPAHLQVSLVERPEFRAGSRHLQCGLARCSKDIQMTDSPKDARVRDIAGELCDLLDQQMKAITDRGLQDLTDEEAAGYELRRTQIAALQAELNAIAYPN
jgi:hypothetical protein